MVRNCMPMIPQRPEQLRIAARSDARSHQDHHVPARQKLLMLAEAFAYQPLDAITRYRSTAVAERHRCSQARMSERIRHRQDAHVAVGSLALALPENLLVLGRGQQAVRAGITPGSAGQGGGSNRQLRAALGPSGFDYQATVLGPHPGTETVGTLALQVAWLESSLHGAIRSEEKDG